MAFANSTVTDIIATTIDSRSGKIADNFTNNNALLFRLKRKGNVKTASGGDQIMQEIGYNDSTSANVNSYSGYEVINVQPNSPISAAKFPWSQYAAAVSMSGREMMQNTGKEQIIDLMEARISIAEGQLQNRIASDLYGDGTGNAGKNLIGLASALADSPTASYGGINRTTFTFWKNQVYSGATNGGAAVSKANIQDYMTALALRCVRGNDKPDLWVGDANYYGMYVTSLQAQQRVMSEEMAGAGFMSIKFFGGGAAADVVMDGGIYTGGDIIGSWSGASANHMFALNTNYIFLRPHAQRNFVAIGGERQAVNQDAVVKLIGWMGNLTSNGPQYSGVLIA